MKKIYKNYNSNWRKSEENKTIQYFKRKGVGLHCNASTEHMQVGGDDNIWLQSLRIAYTMLERPTKRKKEKEAVF